MFDQARVVAEELATPSGSWLQILQLYGSEVVVDLLIDNGFAMEAKQQVREETFEELLIYLDQSSLMRLGAGFPAVVPPELEEWCDLTTRSCTMVLIEHFEVMPKEKHLDNFYQLCTTACNNVAQQIAMLRLVSRSADQVPEPQSLADMCASLGNIADMPDAIMAAWREGLEAQREARKTA